MVWLSLVWLLTSDKQRSHIKVNYAHCEHLSFFKREFYQRVTDLWIVRQKTETRGRSLPKMADGLFFSDMF